MAMEIEDVQVAVMSVDVKVMRIGKRQVTQSVFRQLPFRMIFDFDNENLMVSFSYGLLLGEPWGFVNYFWKDCDPRDGGVFATGGHPHTHVVWQEGGTLYRDCWREPNRFRLSLRFYNSTTRRSACVLCERERSLSHYRTWPLFDDNRFVCNLCLEERREEAIKKEETAKRRNILVEQTADSYEEFYLETTKNLEQLFIAV